MPRAFFNLCLLTRAAQLATVARAGKMFCLAAMSRIALNRLQEGHVSGEAAAPTLRQSGRRGWFVFLAVYSFILAVITAIPQF